MKRIQPVWLWAVLWFAALLTVTGCSGNRSNQEESLAKERALLQEQVTRATSSLDGARISNADSEPQNWLSHGRTYDEQRFSPLDSINEENIEQLSLAWWRNTGSKRGLEATPIVVDGFMFTTGAWSTVHAFDAKTGESIWDYDPGVPKSWGQYACCDVVNRGAAVWKGRVYVGTLDGRLVALDAGTGELDWEVLTVDQERPYTITGAPRIIKDMVIIGNGGAELGVRGYITAYDAETGEQKWRFYTVPGDPSKPFESREMELAAETWNGEWWTIGGGGTVWDSMAYDPELDMLYIGVGNGSPWNRYIRSPGGGDNLYLSSILALNPDRGSLIWHYQTTPGDTWDYTATQHIILADMEIDGVMRKVLVQAPKNGFFYVIDRTDGEFISAEAYVTVTWASHVDPESGRPVVSEEGQYATEAQTVFPGPLGGHNWHPMTFSPATGLVYIPAMDMGYTYGQDSTFEYEPGRWNLGTGGRPESPPEPPTMEELVEGLRSLRAHLLAWDPVEQREVWRVDHPTTWNGGLLSTAGGLVFQGRSDGMFAAYSADDGELLWESEAYTGIIAAPVTYEIDDEQYVAIVAGWGGAFATTSGVPRHKGNVLEEGRVLVYKLNGEANMPPPDITYVNIPVPPDIDGTAEQIENGRYLYGKYCSICHGAGVTSSSQVPDLKYLPSATHSRWNAVILNGIMRGVGMPGFSDVITESDSEDIQRYVIAVTKESIAFCESNYPEQYPELFGTSCTLPVVVEATE
ncbi:MAG: PQQ-dependent dehydrogenase, methanol/ethanol family [Gammaproteobacteria bacterium]|nr:PQQ-dependent dehydrogenase, methanol/ethanol family [Gammaproteobacteria bacterium]MYD80775.1 PQQ-dependent dehydrogenase, methanol/ethanol family [Gammaproteobacteria bacterium]